MKIQTVLHTHILSDLLQQYGCSPQDSRWRYRSTTGRCRSHHVRQLTPPTTPTSGRDTQVIQTLLHRHALVRSLSAYTHVVNGRDEEEDGRSQVEEDDEG